MVIVRLGTCKRCGKCCDPATLPARIEAYRRQGINFIMQHPQGCTHFRYEDGKGVCAIYERRPLMCSVFPRIPADIDALPTCGYSFIWIPQ